MTPVNKQIIFIEKPEDVNKLTYMQPFYYFCKECGKRCYIKGYRKKYSYNYKELLCQDHLKIKRYGSVSPFERKEIQEQIKQKNLEVYGVEYPLQAKSIHDKISENNLAKYGNKSTLHDGGETEAKVKQIFNDKYRVDHPLQNKDIYEATRDSFEKRTGYRYSFEDQNTLQKIKNTIHENYGVDNIMKLPKYQDKAKETKLSIYGNLNNTEKLRQTLLNKTQEEKAIIREKLEQTCLNKYGNKIYQRTDEFKTKSTNTFIENYGVDNPMKSKEVREKYINTMNSNYGVDFVFQSEVFKNYVRQDRKDNPNKYGSKRYIYNNLTFDSFPEFSVYLFCIYNNIPIIRNPNISFTYLDSFRNNHYVYPDFMICGRLVEIKGDMFYKEDGTWYKPWRDESWSNEKYLYECDLQERKRQCLLSNNVLILRDIDSFVLQCVNWVNTFFSNQFIYQFQKSNPNNFCYGVTPYNKSNNKYTDIPGIGYTMFNRNN